MQVLFFYHGDLGFTPKEVWQCKPIKLLGSISKKRLDYFMVKNNIIPEYQIGRPISKGCRTSNHVLLLKHSLIYI